MTIAGTVAPAQAGTQAAATSATKAQRWRTNGKMNIRIFMDAPSPQGRTWSRKHEH
jgi:hypothetical protein